MNGKARASRNGRKVDDIESKHLGLLLVKMTREFHRMQEERARDFYVADLRASHGAVLYYLAERPRRLSELSELNRMRPQSMVKIVNELEELGYVERVPDPADARAKLIRFTKKGEKVLASSRDATNEIFRIYSDIVGEKDLKQMLATMRKLLTGIDEVSYP